ncbi:MAG: PEP/pyruvate-binding domain-containing protein [Acidimicrobiia bacterium]|nr:MAG: PEP/pyruvate-binding domain-containing protein [Acidimicrobiia bacterium]
MQTEALRANLERTAIEVVIPRDQAVLLDIAAPMWGVHQNTERLLKEIHHTYVGWVDTVPELHGRAMRDFFYYNSHERGCEALVVYCDLYNKAVREATPVELRGEALRSWLAYLEKIATESGDRLSRNLQAIDRSLVHIGEIVEGSPNLALPASARLRRLAVTLRSDGATTQATGEAALELLRSVLEKVYTTWLEREDPAEWYREVRSVPPDGEALPPTVAAVSHARLASHLADLEAMAERRSMEEAAPHLMTLPDHVAITRSYLEAADSLKPIEDGEGSVHDRARWLCRLLGDEMLAPIHEKALWALARTSRTLVAESEGDDFERFVDEVFTTLRAGSNGHPASALDFVRSLGVSVLEGDRPDRVDLVIEEILNLGFHRPEFAGFTDEWGIRVNPNHIKNVRTYLGIIDTDPWKARRLVAALVIHLEMGGVFVADTDLFQKDVSTLLGCDIAPVYDRVLHLLRRFPVYFNDIGAEGSLRTVSTRIDEIEGRRDPICHFLRKQSHVESNPMLISVVEEVGHFWATGDPLALSRYLPEEIHGGLTIDDERYRGLHRVFGQLIATGRTLDDLFAGPVGEVEAALEAMDDEAPIDREKVALLFQLRYELARKYALDHADLLDRLRAFHRFGAARIERLARDLDAGRHDIALEALLTIMEDLQRIVLDPTPSTASEDIYRKRHIGTGIPSMYGRYREEKLEAIGLTFRIASLVGALFDQLLSTELPDALDRETLRRFRRWLRLLQRALGIEGYRSWNLESSLSMLDEALTVEAISREELVDIFRSIARSIQSIVQTELLDPYGDVFEILAPRVAADGEITGAPVSGDTGSSDAALDDGAVIRAYETFLRTVIGESMALQRIDNLAGGVLDALSDPGRQWLVEPVAERSVGAPVDVTKIFGGDRSKGLLALGNKGFMLTRLADYGFPVPRGFIISSALSRGRMSHFREVLPDALLDRVKEEISELELLIDSRFGDPSKPLLLSVRAGAPISMPGMLDSFLNVGINPDITEGLAAASGSPWAAWDSYRRFLQFWGMSHGLERDLFDKLMSGAKDRFAVPKKALLPARQMRELAREYRELLADSGIAVVDEPFDQLARCIELVVDSWNSLMARTYREGMGIAEGWGTAVIVQHMVYGNLGPRSGTGVLLTDQPGRDGTVDLTGDFVLQGQGDDVVSGLVETFPISQGQRPTKSFASVILLEQEFPDIHAELRRLGGSLVVEHGLPDQEMEFTFESENPDDLYILQTRESVRETDAFVTTFVQTETLRASKIATGIGVGGGAGSFRLAQNDADIRRLREEFPDEQVLLVRRDTVPDDIHLLLSADALLTAIGGATSHAAVVAKRLGRTCVVGCRALRVIESEGRVEIGGRSFLPGDIVSMNGNDGSVYLGRHEVETREIHRWATMKIGEGA